ncbi:MAG: hypothetical protein PHP00_02630 [Thiotrichaceae bacterium]|nr:hypothetical protein [Thiotrichaceae bacterium]
MTMKRTALASAISLALVGAPAFATTSTVEGQFILDKTSVAVGQSVNLALMGLDKTGAVDQLGEQQGAIVLVTIISEKGMITGGSASPGEKAGDTVAGGVFQGDVKYVKLNQGLGRVNISYTDPNSVGTDTITVTLQERFLNAQGGIVFNTIKSVKKTVAITKADINATRLDIASFTPAAADLPPSGRGVAAGNATATTCSATSSITGSQATAGVGGGQLAVFACLPGLDIDQNANGQLTVTLTSKTTQDKASPVGTEAAATYTFTAPLSKGKAIVTLPSSITKVGSYYVSAKLDTLPNVSSVDAGLTDVLKVVDTGRVKKLGLKTDKTVISNSVETAPASGVNAAATVTLSLLDDYGNVTTGALEPTAPNYNVDLNDANGIVSSTGVTLSYPSATTATLGSAKGQLLKLGETSLVASVKGNTAITASDALKVKVVTQSLIANAYVARTEPFIAGNEYPVFSVAVDGVLSPSVLADGMYQGTADTPDTTMDTAVSANSSVTMNIQNLTSLETVSVNLAQGQAKLLALFKTATFGTKYKISDAAGAFGETIIDVANFMVKPAAASVAQLQNAHNIQVNSVAPSLSSDGKQYVTTLPAASVKIFDSYGNAVSSNGAVTALQSDSGTFSVTSTNGVVSGANLAPFGTGNIAVSYNAVDVGTTKAFVGADPLTLNFTKPGIGSVKVDSTIPAQPVLKTIVANIEQTTIPVNGEVAVTVETYDQNGKPIANSVYGLQNVTLSYSGTLKPTVVDNDTSASLSSGATLSSSASSRKVLIVKAGATTGDFTLTFTNPDKTVTVDKAFKVTTGLIAQCAPASVSACTTQKDCESNGGLFTAATTASGTTAAVAASCQAIPAIASSTDSSVAAVDKTGAAVTVTTSFSGGISVDSASFKQSDTVNKYETTPVKLVGIVTPDAAHVGKVAEIIVAAAFTNPSAGVTTPLWFMMNGNAIAAWDTKLTSLAALKKNVTLTNPTTFTMYDGKFVASGNLSVYMGYRLADGTLVYTLKTIDTVVNK